MKTLLILILLAGTAHAQGVKKWKQKCLLDGTTLDTSIHYATIAELTKLKEPIGKWLPMPRQAVESNLTEVTGQIIEAGKEKDGDYHLALSDGTRTMILEIPDGTLTKSPYSKTWQKLRAFITQNIGKIGAIKKVKPLKVTVRGFIFFDEPNHNGSGHAPNEIEIHPLVYMALAK